ncbi:recombinase [Xenorhabdus hominickii]|uniref:Recombinase n=1 Tax=Xenorhabdus hominickii TaxID=351679 RepID=A0A2G0Q731_XENHO|nr:recombinase [Xenorhabdus hominickii]
MKICVTAAKTILKHLGKPRRSKYEKENYLRIDFSKAGKVTIYAEYPKSMGLKGRKLGEWPDLTYSP